MSFKVTKTQHVLAVDDFEASVAYLIHKLGFTEYKQERWKGWAGSALTVYAQPEAEWQELQLKMHAPMAAWKEAVAESTREGQPAKQDADVLMNGSNPEKA